MRVMILAHGHPDLGAGGAERAAYSLFQRLKTDPLVEEAIFVARGEDAIGGDNESIRNFQGRADEILVSPPPLDTFTFLTLNFDRLSELVGDLVQRFRPDVVHIHHFVFWGLDIFTLFKKVGVSVVFTLHEYAAICAHFGQMFKRQGELCYAASPAACAECFPFMSAGKFFVREAIAKSQLGEVDVFISPSTFLKERYVAWGIPAQRIAVIENLMDRATLRSSHMPAETALIPIGKDRRLVVAFFGQINPFKGVDILLEACSLLPPPARGRIEVRIHGENKHYAKTDFGGRIERLLMENRDVVRPMGAYRNLDVIGLMKDCDWIVVPSIWWENSPIVIQEARLAARPMIYSDIGGVAEKADPSVDIAFPSGNARRLAEILEGLAEGRHGPDAAALSALARTVERRDDESCAAHLALYQSLR